MRRRSAPATAIGLLPSGPFAMLEDAYRLLARAAAITRFPAAPEALASARQQWLDGTMNTVLQEGVATIPVRGALLKDFTWWSWLTGASTYTDIGVDLERALENPGVRAILLDINSPGGETAGLDELTERIYAARAQKPILALVSGTAGSAAYSIAAAAADVVATPGSLLGGIGTVISLEDWSAYEQQHGIQRIEIVSSQTPRKRLDPTTREGRSEIQQVVDAVADVVIAALATYRGVAVETVLADFGQGAVLVGEAAVAAGLADRVGTGDRLHAQLTDAASPRLHPTLPRATMATRAPTGRTTPAPIQSTTDDSQDADLERSRQNAEDDNETDVDAEKDDTGDSDEEKPSAQITTAAALAARYPALTATIRAEAATAERARIAAIQALVRPGLEAIVAASVADPAATAETTALRIVQHEQGQRRGHLSALAGDEAQLDAPANASSDADTADQAVVGRITSTYNAHKRPARAAAGRN